MGKPDEKDAPTYTEAREALSMVQRFIIGLREDLDQFAAGPPRRDFAEDVAESSKKVVKWANDILGGDFDRRRRMARVYYVSRAASNGEGFDVELLPAQYRTPLLVQMLEEAVSQPTRDEWLEHLKLAILTGEGEDYDGPADGSTLEAMILNQRKHQRSERRVLGVDPGIDEDLE